MVALISTCRRIPCRAVPSLVAGFTPRRRAAKIRREAITIAWRCASDSRPATGGYIGHWGRTLVPGAAGSVARPCELARATFDEVGRHGDAAGRPIVAVEASKEHLGRSATELRGVRAHD